MWTFDTLQTKESWSLADLPPQTTALIPDIDLHCLADEGEIDPGQALHLAYETVYEYPEPDTPAWILPPSRPIRGPGSPVCAKPNTISPKPINLSLTAALASASPMLGREGVPPISRLRCCPALKKSVVPTICISPVANEIWPGCATWSTAWYGRGR